MSAPELADPLPPPRSMPARAIGVFLLLNAVAAAPALALFRFSAEWEWINRAFAALVCAGVFFFLAIALCRLFINRYPLQIGPIVPGSAGEFRFCVYNLFVIFFSQLIYSALFPAPLRGPALALFGAKFGRNTFVAGYILDPALVRFGDNVVIGFQSVFVGHSFERSSYELDRIEIESDVTIGLRAIIMPGVMIGRGAIVAAGSVVKRGTRIGPGELWGGVPARLIRRRDAVQPAAAGSPGTHQSL